MMSKLSLRWRITLLMGVLVLTASVLLTLFTIRNAANNFVRPVIEDETNIDESSAAGGESISFSGNVADDRPDGVGNAPKVRINVEHAQQSFSLLSYFYLALVVAGSMIAAYYLAGRAMRPISKLNEALGTMDGKNLSKRLEIPQTNDEIENLTRSFNELLKRLELEFERERRFASNAAHELKTPLATIQTSAQVLNLGEPPTIEEYRENLDVTLHSIKRLSGIIDGLLLLGKSEVEVEFESISIAELFHKVEEELRPCYGKKNITWTYELNVDTLRGNQLLLYRAFFNLIENAYKYTEPNGAITIEAWDEGMETILLISDTGIGISPEDTLHIFEPFYRADKSRSRKIAGAGLGLAIAKEIFDLHKADISMVNGKEGGTRVKVIFPKDFSGEGAQAGVYLR